MRRALNLRTLFTLIFAVFLLLVSNYEFVTRLDAGDLEAQKTLLLWLAKEVAFALLVAVVIYVVFDLFTRQEHEAIFNQRLELVKKNVFFGVFKRKLPEALMDEANSLLLEQRILRTRYDVVYTFRDDTYMCNGKSEPMVLLEGVSQIKVRNISNEPVKFPNRIGLPNPLHADLKKK